MNLLSPHTGALPGTIIRDGLGRQGEASMKRSHRFFLNCIFGRLRLVPGLLSARVYRACSLTSSYFTERE